MRPEKIAVKRRVWAGLVLALAGTGVWWVWTSVTKPRIEAEVKRTQPFVRLAGSGLNTGDQLLRERAEYFDPTPLFFPTDWNFGQSRLKHNIRHEPEQVFGSFGPKLTFQEQNFKSFGTEVDAATERLVDVLGQGNERPLGGMGQVDRPASTLNFRDGFLEVTSLTDANLVMKQALVDISFSHSDYRPVEFLAVVGSAGLVGEPVLVSGSGWEELDSFLRTYLVKTFHLGERLGPGRYRLVVGP